MVAFIKAVLAMALLANGALAQRMCVVNPDTNSCNAEACSGGAYAKWQECTHAGKVASTDTCPDGCVFKAFEGQPNIGACAVEVTNVKTLSPDLLATITSNKCRASAQAAEKCVAALSGWLYETGCAQDCLAEQIEVDEACGKASLAGCENTRAPPCKAGTGGAAGAAVSAAVALTASVVAALVL